MAQGMHANQTQNISIDCIGFGLENVHSGIIKAAFLGKQILKMPSHLRVKLGKVMDKKSNQGPGGPFREQVVQEKNGMRC